MKLMRCYFRIVVVAASSLLIIGCASQESSPTGFNQNRGRETHDFERGVAEMIAEVTKPLPDSEVKTLSIARMERIMNSLKYYHNSHKGKFPDELRDLFTDDHCEMTPEDLRSTPSRLSLNSDDNFGYVWYWSDYNTLVKKSGSDDHIIVYDRALYANKEYVVVGYADWRVAILTKQQLHDAIKALPAEWKIDYQLPVPPE